MQYTSNRISCLSQIRWISVWCRAFEVNFGDLIFPVREELLSVASSSGPGAASSAASQPPHACTHKGETHELGSQFYEDGACERSVGPIPACIVSLFEVGV